MKVTRLGQPQSILTGGTIGGVTILPGSGGSGGGPGGGTTLISNGSNQASWGSNVQVITANGSNVLTGPYVNFASGSGITLSTSSNTMTITSSGSSTGSNFLTKTEGGGDTVVAHGNTGTTETFNPAGGNVHTATLDANSTFTLTSPTTGPACTIELYLTNDTGARTVTWPGSVVWPGGSAPTLGSGGAASVDRILLETLDGGTTWYGVAVGSGGGSALTIKDEGGALATAATSLDFVGAGVVASGAGAAKTITIAGASSAAFAGVLCSNSATQSLANATDVAITFDTETYDTDAFHSTVTNTSRLTVPSGKDGKYRIDAVVQFAAAGGLERRLTIKKNGSTVLWLVRIGPINSADSHFMEIHTPPIALDATDYVEVFAQQDSGGALNSGNTNATPQFGMSFVAS